MCWDHLFLSMSLLQISGGLQAAFCSCWANQSMIVSPLIVRLAIEAGMNGTILRGSEYSYVEVGSGKGVGMYVHLSCPCW